MTRALSPAQNAIFSAGWALVIVLILLVLARFANLTLDSIAVLCGLVLLGPVVSAAFCRRLSGVLLGAIGLVIGLLIVGLIAALFFVDLVDWTRLGLVVPLVLLADLIVSVPLWWCIRRFRKISAPTTSTP
jgi:hypothetical protein